MHNLSRILSVGVRFEIDMNIYLLTKHEPNEDQTIHEGTMPAQSTIMFTPFRCVRFKFPRVSMSWMAITVTSCWAPWSQITSLTIVCSTIHAGRSKKTWKLRVTGLCAWNSPVTGEFPAQMASNAENVSIWWRHHAFWTFQYLEDPDGKGAPHHTYGGCHNYPWYLSLGVSCAKLLMDMLKSICFNDFIHPFTYALYSL